MKKVASQLVNAEGKGCYKKVRHDENLIVLALFYFTQSLTQHLYRPIRKGRPTNRPT